MKNTVALAVALAVIACSLLGFIVGEHFSGKTVRVVETVTETVYKHLTVTKTETVTQPLGECTYTVTTTLPYMPPKELQVIPVWKLSAEKGKYLKYEVEEWGLGSNETTYYVTYVLREKRNSEYVFDVLNNASYTILVKDLRWLLKQPPQNATLSYETTTTAAGMFAAAKYEWIERVEAIIPLNITCTLWVDVTTGIPVKYYESAGIWGYYRMQLKEATLIEKP